jgi:hypothetical protein
LSFQLARKKLLKEPAWTIVIVAVMVVGLTGWIVTPAIGGSLRSGLSSYANTSATYVVVEYSGSPQGRTQTLPLSLVQVISAIGGVQTVYPVDVNYTAFNFPNYTQPPLPGRNVSIKGAVFYVASAVIGGPYGFPATLIGLTSGKLPLGPEPGFVVNSPLLLDQNTGRTFEVGDNASVSVDGDNFTASAVGVNSYNPLIGDYAQALWNSTFFKAELGQRFYNETFGVGADLLIVKVVSIEEVGGVASQTTSALQDYPAYRVDYDQATVNNLVSVETGTAPLYELIGVVSLASSVAALFFVSYIAVNRRGWEVGLFVSQGWSWNRVTKFFLEYFLFLAVISYVLSLTLSFLVSQYTAFSYQVYGSVLRVQASIGLSDMISAGLIAVVVSAAISYFMRWRLSKSSLDSALREY